MLSPLVRTNTLSFWTDDAIKPGALWKEEIRSALGRAKVAVLLVSPNFLASKFIAENELPPLLAAARGEGVIVMWTLISQCLYETTEIAQFQATHDISRPLDSLKKSGQNDAIAEICRKIAHAAQ